MVGTGHGAIAGVMAGLCILAATSGAAERINHEGRILGPLPVVTNAILFNTPQADAVVSAMQIFPRDNAWNEDISRRPVLSNSAAMISRIVSDLATDRRTLRPFYEMNFVLVPNLQPPVPIGFDNPPEFYPDESDPSPYPFATNTPVELWPRGVPGTSLTTWQRTDDGSDRHSIIVQPGSNHRLLDVRSDELARGHGRKVQYEHQRASSSRLDIGGCRGAFDVRRIGALR
jgi:hypothetical protein